MEQQQKENREWLGEESLLVARKRHEMSFLTNWLD
jgi:hypothetical protein